MKFLIAYIKENRFFFSFIFIFSWVLSLKNNVASAFVTSWKDFNFHFDTPFWLFINAILINLCIDYLHSRNNYMNNHSGFKIRFYVKSIILAFIFYLIYINLFALSIGLIFGTLQQNFGSSWHFIVNELSYILDFITFGSISLVYIYYKENDSYQKKLRENDLSIAKSKIKQLKSQLNPHFLFNNLNVLDHLILENQEEASEFLGVFSELYRYALRSSEKELVPLSDELTFAENYFELMQHRYPGAYILHIDVFMYENRGYLPPLCLQVVIENAIFHNYGTVESPIIIKISGDQTLRICNNKKQHKHKRKGNSIALKNLKEQFNLLDEQVVRIEDTNESYTIWLPIIKEKI